MVPWVMSHKHPFRDPRIQLRTILLVLKVHVIGYVVKQLIQVHMISVRKRLQRYCMTYWYCLLPLPIPILLTMAYAAV